MECVTYHLSVFITLCLLWIHAARHSRDSQVSDDCSIHSGVNCSGEAEIGSDHLTTDIVTVGSEFSKLRIMNKSELLKMLPVGSQWNTDVDISIEVTVSGPDSAVKSSPSLPPHPSTITDIRRKKNRKRKRPKYHHGKSRRPEYNPKADGSDRDKVFNMEWFDESSPEADNDDHDHEHMPPEMDIYYGKLVDTDAFILEDFDDSGNIDWCMRWLNCSTAGLALRSSILHQLPSCPCFFPMDLRYSDALWDKIHRRSFRWYVADDERYQNHVYRLGAVTCIRSHPSPPPEIPNVAIQQCCYDNRMTLITRGHGAGTPILVSPRVSEELHYDVDLLPWVLCKGDWTRYHSGRPPDNRGHCKPNPKQKTYRQQLKEAQFY